MLSALKKLSMLMPPKIIEYFLFIYPCLLFIISLKLILNTYRLLKTYFYFFQYNKYLKKRNWHFIQYKHGVINIFKSAGINNSYTALLEPAGYNMLQEAKVSIFENIEAIKGDIPSIVKTKFNEAIGIFKSRIIESINPFFWLEFIVFLPKHILEYCGVKSGKVVINIVQVIYWLSSIYKILKTIISIWHSNDP